MSPPSGSTTPPADVAMEGAAVAVAAVVAGGAKAEAALKDAAVSSYAAAPKTLATATTTTANAVASLTPTESELAITNLCRLISYPTVSATAPSTGAYKDAATFIIDVLKTIPCLDSISILEESPADSPVVIARWRGIDESLPVVLLNSHYDVVPADESEWTVKPFEGVRKDGKIYGRGAQDMKCVCIQYIEAIRKLHTLKPSYRPQRSIYLSFVPDEEVGGSGMSALLASKFYANLPGIALALDEGLASTNDTYSVFYGERLPWWIDVTARGNTGHGSRFIESTAVEQIVELANKALAFRKGQRDALHGSGNEDHSNCSHAIAAKRRRLNKEKIGNRMVLGDVTSLNITTIQAGVRSGDTFAFNCVPPVAKCSLDIRISPHVEPKEISDMLDGWCRECSADAANGHQLTWDYNAESGGGNDLQQHALTSTDPKINPWYQVFSDAMTTMGMTIEPEVFPAATDSRFLRALGVRALGFSPMKNTEIMLHENDEYLEEQVFVEGIGVYVNLIEALGKAGKDIDDAADAAASTSSSSSSVSTAAEEKKEGA